MIIKDGKGLILPFNKTLKQRGPGHKLFIKLPDEFVLKNLEAGNPATYPSISEVFIPYPSILFNTPYIEPILLSTGENRKSAVAMAVTEMINFNLGAGLSVQKELKAIEEAGLPQEYVLGDEYNDGLDIQDNEREFYDAVDSWVKYYTKQDLKKTCAGKTDEELDELVQLSLERGNIPDNVLDFFITMIQEAIRYSYSHSPEVPFDIDTLSGEEDTEETVELIYFIERKDKQALTGEVIATSYISGQARLHGYKVWIEALIKLFRWGERKPRNLIVPNNANNILDLKTFKMSTKTMDISSLEKVRLESGKYAKVIGIAPGYVFSGGEMQEMLSVLMLETSYKIPNTEETISNYQHIYLGDVVDAYLNGENFIDGITLENGEFIIHNQAIDQTDEIEADLASKFKPYLTAAMIRIVKEKGLNEMVTSSSMLTEPKKSYIYLKQYVDIEKEMLLGSVEIKSRIWYGSKIFKDSANTFLFSEEFKQYTLSDMLDVFLHMRRKEETGMCAIVYKGDKSTLSWQSLVSVKEYKDEIDPQTRKPKKKTKVVGFININQETKRLIVASLQDGVSHTAGTNPVMLAPVFQWMVDALLIASGVPATQDRRLEIVSKTSLTDIMSARLI